MSIKPYSWQMNRAYFYYVENNSEQQYNLDTLVRLQQNSADIEAVYQMSKKQSIEGETNDHT
ncbi:hypothetical protein [Desulfitobacterium sp. LBE]|uniref:hypothetical protein n=1 Tax=Desulfitobacterium sp. LBE TaxID=884086 RepID=UPI0011A40670|nr:hypothetical protein [Desulfitobacterium sp. LBE]